LVVPGPHERLAEAISDRYTITREVGAGGMATVFLARDIKHDRDVALKVLRPELAAAMGSDRFPREIRTVAQFNHPHILSLYDSGEVQGLGRSMSGSWTRAAAPRVN
jgi:serine/threonine-protein kinase